MWELSSCAHTMAKACTLNQAEFKVLTPDSRVVTFIKHCKEHYKLLPHVLVPIVRQGACKMPQDASLYRSASTMPVSQKIPFVPSKNW